MSTLLADVHRLMEASQLACQIASLKTGNTSSVFDGNVCSLTTDEIALLEAQGNRAENWAHVRIAGNLSAERIWNNRFLGQIVLGRFTGESRDLGDGVVLSPGVYNSTIRDANIGDDAIIDRVGLLSQTVVQRNAAVVSSGSISCSGETCFGCGEELSLGVETGERAVRSFAELTVSIAWQLACDRGNRSLLGAYDKLVDDYLDRIRVNKTLICVGTIIRDTGQLVNCFIGPGAVVCNARRLADSCLLSNPGEPTKVADGACVARSILQWGASVDSTGLVETSVVCEQSHVTRHGKLSASILGPNSGVAEGEVTASLVGPFVGFHHQALLIAALWPQGKGNIGYGANIGSNHTGRAPDQEIYCGEGTFFGLGCSIKFPTDLSRSPYSIIASGVTCLPQKVEFPFSLINTPSARVEGVSPSFNEIFPGWVLANNLYMIKRNEAKYQSRNRARREHFRFDVFRFETVELMQNALDCLLKAGDCDFYTDKRIPGLGKNYLAATSLRWGIETYRFYIRYAALNGLKEQLVGRGLCADSPEAAKLLAEPSDNECWEQHRKNLTADKSTANVAPLLEQLIASEQKIAEAVETSKAKDDHRGERIIPDYNDVHKPAAEDDFVRETWQRFEDLRAVVHRLLGRN